jgi:soluble lytic murein transglycosylase
LVLARLGYRLAGIALAAAVVAAIPDRTLAGDMSAAVDALLAADQGDWAQARQLAAMAQDPIVAKLVLWLDATRSQGIGSFTEITGFIIDNPDWPSQKLLRQRAEQVLDDNTSDLAILSWFAYNEPLTLPGAKRYASALMAAGEMGRAHEVARTAWRNVDAQAIEDEDDFYATFGDVLTNEDHARRIDRLLWASRISPAQRILPLVDAGNQALEEARIALRQLGRNAPGLVALVPAELQSDPGLVFDQARWYRRKENEAAARQVLLHYRVDGAQPDQFWQERGQLARGALNDGNAGEAYRVASEHGFSRGSEFADSEWLAGWIALRFLQQPEVAARHFLAMFENVRHPVSRARGAYWLARTAAAMGDTETALLWHKTAAQHAVAFYGQLSAAEIRPEQPLRLPGDPPISAAEAQSFENHELVRAIRLLTAAGEREPQRAFVLRLADLSDAGSWKDLTASLAHEIDRPDLAVAVARQSIRAGTPLVRNGYPVPSVLDTGQQSYAVESPLVYAIVRQESAFDVRAVSPAGAQGLMQLMPGTARSVAGTLGLPYSPSDLTGSPQYNLSLGSAYIANLLDRFAGSYILALAAYNAGPSRVNQWLSTNGDPRVGTEAAIDWIEQIPFSETRNYVQRCLENLQVYRARTGTMQLAQTPDADLVR